MEEILFVKVMYAKTSNLKPTLVLEKNAVPDGISTGAYPAFFKTGTAKYPDFVPKSTNTVVSSNTYINKHNVNNTVGYRSCNMASEASYTSVHITAFHIFIL